MEFFFLEKIQRETDHSKKYELGALMEQVRILSGKIIFSFQYTLPEKFSLLDSKRPKR